MSFDKQKVIASMNTISENTLMRTLDIEYIDAGPDYLVAKMPVTAKVHQPMGLLHGGATLALAESVGSAASQMVALPNQKIKGLEISANHLKSVSSGVVFATARIIHKGRTTHLWEIRVTDEQENLISICKLTNIVLHQ